MSSWTELARAPTWTFALAAAGVLSACAAVGPNFTPPTPPADAGFAMAGDARPPEVTLTPTARAAGPWWQSLGSPDLNAVMAQALAGNQTVAEADATLSRVREDEAVARADRKPRIDANGAIERERINTQIFGIPGFPSPTFNLYNIGATVNYALDLAGGERRRVEGAGARREAQARRADAAYLTLTGNVALQAVRIAALREETAALDAIIADDRQAIDIARRAEAAGGEARTAGLGGQAQLEADLALGPPVAQQLAQARHALAALVGRAPGAWTAPDFAFAGFTPPPTIPLSLPSALAAGRPDILAAQADLHADTAAIGVATANLYPNINLVAGLTQGALTPGAVFSFDSTAYNFGAAATAPIFHGGALRAQRRAAEAQARASLARYRQTVVTAFVQVADVLSSLAQDDRQLQDARQAEATANASLADARTAFRLGGGAYAGIVTATRQVDRARLNRVDAAARRLEDVVSLYAATAGDWGHPKPA